MDDDNLSPDQTEKLIHFQEVTHIESFDECRRLLEAYSWNIELAVQNTLTDQLEQQQPQQEPQQEENNLLNNLPSSSSSSSSSSNASTHTNNNNLNNINNHQNLRQFYLNNSNSSNNLPAVNIITQRSLSYHNQTQTPRGIWQWSYFLIAFPFRFLYSTFFDFLTFFWNIYENNRGIEAGGGNNSLALNNYDPLANIAEFIIYYNQKYGVDNHPTFYQGSYTQAVNEAKRDLKYLLIYLHDNDNEDCDLFATETLANRDVIDYLNDSVLFWACSKNLPEGKKVFNALKAKRSPFLGLILLRHSKMTLVTKMEGPIQSGELILQLSQMITDYDVDMATARYDKEQRNQTQLLREQQDQAYAECLKLDQEKSRKQRELDEAQRKAKEEEILLLQEEKRKADEIINLKIELKKQLEYEPDASFPNAIKLVLKLPNGNRIDRVFLKTDPVKNLYNFVFCHDECPKNFEIVTNFPRKVIECTHTTDTPLEKMGINQPMLLFISDLDA